MGTVKVEGFGCTMHIPAAVQKETNTVKLRFTDTRLIRTPHYYGQFPLSLGWESPYIFSKFSPVNTETFYGSFSIRTGFDCLENQIQSNPINADIERFVESVRINGVSVLSGLDLEKM